MLRERDRYISELYNLLIAYLTERELEILFYSLSDMHHKMLSQLKKHNFIRETSKFTSLEERDEEWNATLKSASKIRNHHVIDHNSYSTHFYHITSMREILLSKFRFSVLPSRNK